MKFYITSAGVQHTKSHPTVQMTYQQELDEFVSTRIKTENWWYLPTIPAFNVFTIS